MKTEDYQRKNAELERLVAAQTKELDIKNRELEVEAALERVRAASMAMHNSSELPSVALVLVNQLAELNVQQLGSSIVIIDEEKETYRQYSAHDNLKDQEKILNAVQDFHLNEIHFGREILRLARSGEKEFTIELRGALLQEWMTYVKNKVHEQRGEAMLQAGFEGIYFYFAKFHGLSSIVISTLQPLPDTDRDILRRMANTFGMSYRRYLDLKKAEAQVREARIEAALERVRSRTMAMRKSEELAETAFLMFHQLKELGLAHYNCGFVILNPDDLSGESWFSGGEVVNETVPWRFDIDPTLRSVYEAWKKGSDFFEVDLSGEALERHYQNIEAYFRTLDFKTKLLQAADVYFTRIIGQHAFFSHGFLKFHFDTPNAETAILKRFARVFEQTYTRFLDLQKAEAQAREAQIEMTLERVRSRTLAMQKSEELTEVVDTIFLALEQLDYNPLDCTIVTFDHDSRKMDCWSSMPTGQGISSFSYSLPYIDHPMLNKMFLYHREQKPFLIYHLAGEEKVTYDDLFFEAVPIPEMEAVLRAITETNGNFIFMSHGAVAAFTPEPMSESDLALLQRFSKVVDLSYTRFLDLKKAEAQAREAQIETALERVRSRTMAMNRSEELTQIASQIYVELEALGIKPWAFGFNIWMAGQAATEAWSCSGSPDIMWEMMVPHTEDPTLKNIYSFKNAGKPLYKDTLQGKVLQQHFTYMASLSGLSEVMDDILAAKGTLPEPLFINAAYFKQGYLLLTSLAESADVNSILVKFAKVFEQTYTRFLDLQKAEAQAREAQIEAALDRVRARTMAMHHSNELLDCAQLLFQQLEVLGFELTVCGFSIIDKDSPKGRQYISIAGTLFPEPLPIQYDEDLQFKRTYKEWKDGKSSLILDIQGEELKRHLAYNLSLFKNLNSIEVLINTTGKFKKRADQQPDRLVVHHAFFEHGALFLSHNKPVGDMDVLVRFAKVFEQTYTRFLDLQKAEAHAREAARQASIDRVRAEIASMRTAEDLERITPLIWRELTALGVPFFRCGVFIIREPDELVHAYLSTPEGQSLAVLHLPFDGAETTRNIVDNWRRQHIYADHWDRSQFQAWVQAMVDEGQLREVQQYQAGEAPPESLSLQFIPFIQGMLYVGSNDPLSEDQLVLVKSLADAFSVAYARYEDFNSLEQAKNRVESTLTELKATQTQLIQQEKLASLGQLTAGIAHEIKNPLNFVTNFSEVSRELLDDLREEIKKGDWVEVEAITGDLQQNLEKIHHHGSRADGIVQAMLLHARGGSGKPELTGLNAFVREYVNLAYHGMRAGKEPINVSIDLVLDEKAGQAPLVVEDFSRVILNLCQNAFDAMRGKLQEGNEKAYQPKLAVHTRSTEEGIRIEITDNGPGIPEAIRDKILQPFFTTKKGTEGTGLGLSISNDIVKAHGGKMSLRSAAGAQTSFTITLPITSKEA